MSRGTRLGLACLTLFFLLFPLAVGKPGLPPTLKADEPAYFLMAMSLAFDGDLLCEVRDLDRLAAEYPFLPTNNLILSSRDGWRTVHFGKPWIYSLLAAPAARLFGGNGLVAFNMALFLLMVWLGTAWLGRRNAPAVALAFAAGFYFLSSGFAYVHWLQPEVFNMAAVAICLHLGLWRGEDGGAPPGAGGAGLRAGAGRPGHGGGLLARPGLALALSGAALALGAYNKPVLAALGLPVVLPALARRRWGRAAAWIAGFVAAAALLVAASLALTGQASAYLGAQRAGVPVFDPAKMPVEQVELAPMQQSPTGNSWSWIFRIPRPEPALLARDLGYFLWGRHTGLLLYMPFAGLAVLLFLLHRRRRAEGWLILASLALVALFFLIWIPFNWHGGGGFVGNRYFVNVYPAFLYLVGAVRPRWLTAAGFAAGGLFLGPILFTPFGAPVPEPTLQAHVRNPPFRHFPLELPMLRKLPGYTGVSQLGVRFVGRRDVFQRHRDEIWVQGATRSEIWVRSPVPLEAMAFGVRSPAPGNAVTLGMDGGQRRLQFAQPGMQFATLEPGEPAMVLEEEGRPIYLYRLGVHPERGRIPPEQVERAGRFYLGAALVYFGPTDPRARDLYDLSWGGPVVPERMEAGAEVRIATRVTNRSGEPWPADGPAPVKLSYHWLGPDGIAEVVWDGLRTPLPHRVVPGETVSLPKVVEAPAEPGRYVLALDLVYENVSWFSRRNGGLTWRAEVEVVSADKLGEGGGEGDDGSLAEPS